MAFTIELDTNYFLKILNTVEYLPCEAPCFSVVNTKKEKREIEVVYLRQLDATLFDQQEQLFIFHAKLKCSFPEPLPSAMALIQIKDIVAMDRRMICYWMSEQNQRYYI